jgi:cAMP-dependent protein kinase regulator
LQQTGAERILADLKSELLQHKPTDPVEFMITYLQNYATTNKKQKHEARMSPSQPKARPVKMEEESNAPDDESNIDYDSYFHSLPSAPRRRMAICSEPVDTGALDSAPVPLMPKSPQLHRELEEALRTNILFAHLEEEERKEVFDAMVEVKYAAGEVIIRQGDEGDNFYVVKEGICEIWVQKGTAPPNKVMTVGKSGSFGELALIYGTQRAATVKATTDVVLWAIDRITYRRILMAATMRKRKLYESFLEKVPILAPLQKYERLTVADALEAETFQDGQVIIKQGDPGDAFYIITDGEVKVMQDQGNGVEVEVARLYTSAYFGEIALLTDRPRAATVIAVGTCKCAKMDRERFNRVMGPCEEILRRNMEIYNQYMSTKI